MCTGPSRVVSSSRYCLPRSVAARASLRRRSLLTKPLTLCPISVASHSVLVPWKQRRIHRCCIGPTSSMYLDLASYAFELDQTMTCCGNHSNSCCVQVLCVGTRTYCSHSSCCHWCRCCWSRGGFVASMLPLLSLGDIVAPIPSRWCSCSGSR